MNPKISDTLESISEHPYILVSIILVLIIIIIYLYFSGRQKFSIGKKKRKGSYPSDEDEIDDLINSIYEKQKANNV